MELRAILRLLKFCMKTQFLLYKKVILYKVCIIFIEYDLLKEIAVVGASYLTHTA